MKFSAAFFTVSFSPRSESVSCFLQSKFSPSKVFGCNIWVHAKAFTECAYEAGSLLIQTQGIFHHQWSWEKIGDQITLKHTTHLWRRKHRSLDTSGSNPSMSTTIMETNWSYMFCTIYCIFYSMFVHLQCFRCGNIGCWLFSRREEQVLLVMWQFPSIGQCCPTTNRRESVYWSSRIRI